MTRTSVFAILVMLSPRQAGARELAYTAPIDCPARGEVVRQIEARAPDGRRAEIHVSRHSAGYRGQVVLGEGEDLITRVVEAAHCSALVDALVLVIALDSRQDENVNKDNDEVEGPAKSEVRSSYGETIPLPPPKPALPSSGRPASSAAPAVSAVSSIEISVAAGAGFAWAVAAPSGIGELYVEIASAQPWFGSPWLHPSVRAAVARTTTATVDRGPYEARFAWTFASIEGCPMGLRSDGGRFFVPVCLRVETGRIEASAIIETTRPWLAGGVASRPRIFLANGSIRPFVEIGGTATAVFVRDSFTLPGESPVQPTFALSVALGGGATFR